MTSRPSTSSCISAARNPDGTGLPRRHGLLGRLRPSVPYPPQATGSATRSARPVREVDLLEEALAERAQVDRLGREVLGEADVIPRVLVTLLLSDREPPVIRVVEPRGGVLTVQRVRTGGLLAQTVDRTGQRLLRIVLEPADLASVLPDHLDGVRGEGDRCFQTPGIALRIGVEDHLLRRQRQVLVSGPRHDRGRTATPRRVVRQGDVRGDLEEAVLRADPY